MLRFYLDEHVADAVARALRAQGIEVETAVEAKMAGHGVPDPNPTLMGISPPAHLRNR